VFPQHERQSFHAVFSVHCSILPTGGEFRIFEFGQLNCQPALEQLELALRNERKTNPSTTVAISIDDPAHDMNQDVRCREQEAKGNLAVDINRLSAL
jgi:hypothetical protein